MGRVLVVGTRDTKGAELDYVAGLLADAGVAVTTVDVGTTWVDTGADVTAEEVAAHHPDGAPAVRSDDRGTAITAMSEALARWVGSLPPGEVAGMIGVGGSGGTALLAPAMRALDVGIPKLLVSTVASGQVGQYVGPSDLTMVHSVTDVAGLNRISRRVLGNAAHAMAGMASHPIPPAEDDRPAIALTMFGVTTPLVTALVDALQGDHDPLVFHATGTGGRSMEKLVDSGLVVAVMDMTTTEVADHIAGGIFSAGPERMDAIARTGVPYVGSVGALDMVNFGARDTVPDRYADRLLHVHNAQVTLMRTTAEENVAMGRFIAAKLNAMPGPVRVLLPEGGVSLLDAPGQPFHDPQADAALFATIEADVQQTPRRVVRRVPHAINDPAFAAAALAALREVLDDDVVPAATPPPSHPDQEARR